MWWWMYVRFKYFAYGHVGTAATAAALGHVEGSREKGHEKRLGFITFWFLITNWEKKKEPAALHCTASNFNAELWCAIPHRLLPFFFNFDFPLNAHVRKEEEKKTLFFFWFLNLKKKMRCLIDGDWWAEQCSAQHSKALLPFAHTQGHASIGRSGDVILDFATWLPPLGNERKTCVVSRTLRQRSADRGRGKEKVWETVERVFLFLSRLIVQERIVESRRRPDSSCLLLNLPQYRNT